MSDAATCMERLDSYSLELDKLSNELASTERLLGGWTNPDGQRVMGIEEEYETFLDRWETACWDRHEKDDAKLPAEKMRLRLARREMPSELLGKHTELLAKRKRIEKRISALKSEIEAQRSILSALKLEAEASGNGLRGAA